MTHATKDINQAAYLWSLPGAAQTDTYMEDRSVFFIIDVPDKTESEILSLLCDFRNRRVLVEPVHFCSLQDQLRQLVRAHMRKM